MGAIVRDRLWLQMILVTLICVGAGMYADAGLVFTAVFTAVFVPVVYLIARASIRRRT